MMSCLMWLLLVSWRSRISDVLSPAKMRNIVILMTAAKSWCGVYTLLPFKPLAIQVLERPVHSRLRWQEFLLQKLEATLDTHPQMKPMLPIYNNWLLSDARFWESIWSTDVCRASCSGPVKTCEVKQSGSNSPLSLPESAQGRYKPKIWPIVLEVHWIAKLSIPEG